MSARGCQPVGLKQTCLPISLHTTAQQTCERVGPLQTQPQALTMSSRPALAHSTRRGHSVQQPPGLCSGRGSHSTHASTGRHKVSHFKHQLSACKWSSQPPLEVLSGRNQASPARQRTTRASSAEGTRAHPTPRAKCRAQRTVRNTRLGPSGRHSAANVQMDMRLHSTRGGLRPQP